MYSYQTLKLKAKAKLQHFDMPSIEEPVFPSQLFDGVVEPSEAAYDDIFVKGKKVDMKCISLFSSQEQFYSEELNDFTGRFSHEVYYKGEMVWKTETDVNDQDGGFRSSCRLASGCLEMVVIFDHTRSDAAKARGKPFMRKKQLDLDSLVRGSAAAHQLYSADDEIEQKCGVGEISKQPGSGFLGKMVSSLS